MNTDEIPQELIDMLDQAAGKKHSRNGQVMTALAAILTRYDEIHRDDTAPGSSRGDRT